MVSSGTTSTGLFVSIQPVEGLSSQVLDALLTRVRRRIGELSIDLANITTNEASLSAQLHFVLCD